MMKTPIQRRKIDWQIFKRPESINLGLDRVRLVGNGNPVTEYGRCGISTTIFGKSPGVVFSMDNNEVRDLIDALQKYLSVVENA